jgi:[ribosomal protein S5]-alanine N-acetyltransferase
MKASDSVSLCDILGDPEVMRWALMETALTRSAAKEFLQTHFAADHDAIFGLHTVAITADDSAIGFSGYRECDLLDEADLEFGWVIAQSHHGQGYATRLGNALIQHALLVLGRRRVLAACNPENLASKHVLSEKLGMRFERHVERANRLVYSIAEPVASYGVAKDAG